MRLLEAECGIGSVDALRAATGGDWASVTAVPRRRSRRAAGLRARSGPAAWSSVPARWAPWLPSPAGTSPLAGRARGRRHAQGAAEADPRAARDAALAGSSAEPGHASPRPARSSSRRRPASIIGPREWRSWWISSSSGCSISSASTSRSPAAGPAEEDDDEAASAVVGLAMAIVLAACGGDGDGGQGPVDEGEPPVAGCTDGTTSGGALTRVCFPADWNGDLILYAHGYVQPDAPLAIPDNLIGGTPVRGPDQRRSATPTPPRATARTASWRTWPWTTWCSSRTLVRRTVRPDPLQVYVVGVSEGGLVAALAAERTAGPVHRRARGLRPDRRLRPADRLLQRCPRGVRLLLPRRDSRQRRSSRRTSVRAGWDATYAPAVVGRAGRRSRRGARAGHRHRRFRPTGVDPASLAEAVAGHPVVQRVRHRGRAGPAGRPALRQRGPGLRGLVRRRGAERRRRALHRRLRPRARRWAASRPAAIPSVPISILHTTGDPIVPVLPPAALRRQGVQPPAGARCSTARDVDRFGHCDVQRPSELLAAFGALPQ